MSHIPHILKRAAQQNPSNKATAVLQQILTATFSAIEIEDVHSRDVPHTIELLFFTVDIVCWLDYHTVL